MAKRFLPLLAVASMIMIFSHPARAGELYGMLQMSRDDGLVAFYLIGTFNERTACEQRVATIIDPFVGSAEAAGHSA